MRATTAYRYERDFLAFKTWCEEADATPLPTSTATLIRYIHQLAERNKTFSTIERALYGIAHEHAKHNLPSPITADVREALLALDPHKTTFERKPTRPLDHSELLHILSIIPAGDTARPRDRRDRALLLIGRLGGLKNFQLARLDLADLRPQDDALSVRVVTSTGETKYVKIANEHGVDAVHAVSLWLEIRGRVPGPLFLGIENGTEQLMWGPSDTPMRLSPAAIGAAIRTRAKAAQINATGGALRNGAIVDEAWRAADLPAGEVQRQIARKFGYKQTRHLDPLLRSARREAASR